MKYNQELPKEVEERLDAYIKRIKAIKWFQPSHDIKREDVQSKLDVVLETFGVKASLKFEYLKNNKDWDAAWDATRDAARDATRDAAWDAAWDATRGAAWGAARDAAWDAAWDATRGAAWGAARDAALGAEEILVQDLKIFNEKYPNGAFQNLIPLWEMGLYPVGIIDGEFIIYVPPVSQEFPKGLDN